MSWDYKWWFDGVGGAAAVSVIVFALNHLRKSINTPAPETANTAVGNCGSVFQAIESPTTVNVALPPAPAGMSARRYEEWRHLNDEMHKNIEAMSYTFVPLHAYKPGDPRCDPDEGIVRGNRALQSCILIANALEKNGIRGRWRELVAYVVRAESPREPNQRGAPTANGFNLKVNEFILALRNTAQADVGS